MGGVNVNCRGRDYPTGTLKLRNHNILQGSIKSELFKDNNKIVLLFNYILNEFKIFNFFCVKSNNWDKNIKIYN